MRKVKFQFTYTEDPNSIEKHTGLSETIEGQSQPIRDIIVKFQRGTLEMDIQMPVYYDNIDDFNAVDPTLRPDYDITDAQSDLIALRQTIAEKNAIIAEQQKTLSTTKTGVIAEEAVASEVTQ